MNIQKPRGTIDYTDEAYDKKRKIVDAFVLICEASGFEGIETPMFEEKNLFVRSVGDETDIVQKELFDLAKKSDSLYSLRPELTAGIVRSEIENGLKNKKLPVQLYTVGPIFRYDKPQKGRFRQSSQLDAETIGFKNETTDICTIALALRFFQKIGLQDKIAVSFNTFGSDSTKQKYTLELKKFLLQKKDRLCADCQRRADKNPLRVLDCKNVACKENISDAPGISQYLEEDEKSYFDLVVESVKALGFKADADETLVRGIDYYNGVVFEISLKTDLSRALSLGGGGRYDSLVRDLGGPDLPAFGFGLGIERISDAMATPEESGIKKIIIVPLSESALQAAIEIQDELNTKAVSKIFTKSFNLSKALAEASDDTFDLAVIIGDDELKKGEYMVKNLKDKTQKSVRKDGLNSIL